MKPPQKKKNPKKNKPLNQWIVLSSIAFQMGGTLLVMAWLGGKVDDKFDFQKPWWTITFVIFGVIISLYSVLKQLKKLNQQQEK